MFVGLLLAGGFVAAQELGVRDYTALIASEISAVYVACPSYLTNLEVDGQIRESACFEFDGSENLLRLSVDRVADSYSDFFWIGPWTGGSPVFRAFTVGDDRFAMYVLEMGAYELLVVVYAMD